MDTVANARDALEEMRRSLWDQANAQFDSPQFRRLFALRMSKARAAVYMVQRTLWTINRREAWALSQAVAPLEVKKLIWEHEREELEGDAARDMPDHYTLGVQEAASVGMTPEDFDRIGPCDGLLTCTYAWRQLAGHNHWLKAFASIACLDISNSDAIVKGGGMSHRMAVKFRDEAGLSFKQQTMNVEHMSADVRHATLFMEVAERHALTPEARALMLEGARESWAIDRVWKGQLAEVIAAVPE
jgi:hypothetical protein